MTGILILTLEGAACEARNATSNLATNSAFIIIIIIIIIYLNCKWVSTRWQ
jgi:hypothetical protein